MSRGLTELMGRMSTAEYNEVRQWVLDGARNPETGRYNAPSVYEH